MKLEVSNVLLKPAIEKATRVSVWIDIKASFPKVFITVKLKGDSGVIEIKKFEKNLPVDLYIGNFQKEDEIQIEDEIKVSSLVMAQYFITVSTKDGIDYYGPILPTPQDPIMWTMYKHFGFYLKMNGWVAWVFYPPIELNCPRCFNEKLGTIHDPNCPICHGSGRVGGYFGPFETIITRMGHRAVQTTQLKTKDETVAFYKLAFPYVGEGDFVAMPNGEIYKVVQVQDTYYNNHVLSQLVTAELVNINSGIYKFVQKLGGININQDEPSFFKFLK